MSESLRIGVVGCGVISDTYFRNARWLDGIEIVACADLELSRAEAAADAHRIPHALDLQDIFHHDEIDAILNLTTPAAHSEISLRALRNGRHVYSEKPLAIRRRDAKELMGLARQRGLRIGCAPDTVLGAGLQTARHAIDSGLIGTPVSAAAFCLSPGMEHWHPNPHFFYKKGGGPLFDMGPYYLSALLHLLGPVAAVNAMGRIVHPRRLITSQPLAGSVIDVEIPTHISANLEFEEGPLATFIASYDVREHDLPPITIFGTEGTLAVPDPNRFDGPVRFRAPGDDIWRDLPFDFPHSENSRGLGLADMAAAIREGTGHRCNESVAFHVLDVMHCVLDSAESGKRIEVMSRAGRPDPMPSLLSLRQ